LLKGLVLVFTLFERAQTQQSQPIRDDFLGEVRIPLSKIHKKLASKSDNTNEASGNTCGRMNMLGSSSPHQVYFEGHLAVCRSGLG
uniref:Secreted protein n=1 Tax=Hymenolepis diminuta TaxID=6216 RepID=A0A0R3SLR7_HYMDI